MTTSANRRLDTSLEAKLPSPASHHAHLLSTHNDHHLLTKKHPDIAHWGWVTAAFWAGVDIDEFPHLKAWEERMLARPGVEKGRHVPEPHRMKEMAKKDPKEIEKAAAAAREWIQSVSPLHISTQESH